MRILTIGSGVDIDICASMQNCLVQRIFFNIEARSFQEKREEVIFGMEIYFAKEFLASRVIWRVRDFFVE